MTTIAAGGVPEIVQRAPDHAQGKAIEPQVGGAVLSGRQLRRIRRFAIAGGGLGFCLRLGVGFLVRWLGLGSQIHAYDEFALLLITVASRDLIFGAFLGVALS